MSPLNSRPSIESLEPRTLFAAAPPVVTVVATQPDCAEANRTTTGRGVLTVTRTGSTASALVVKYAVNGNSTAIDGVDFDHLDGLVTIPAGKKSAFIKITPVNDSLDEPTERIMISLKSRSTYVLGAKRNANLTIRDNDPTLPPAGWWDTNRHFRAAINADVGSFARSNQVVERSINFTTLLSQSGGSGSLMDDSIRVIETNADGSQVVDQDVPFQFDKDGGFNASSNASGNLVFVAKGNTTAGQTRHYHVYFDTAGSFSPFSFASQITTTDNDSDEGQTAIKVDTQTATYWLQKQNGGFSSIVDKSGNDWLGFNPTPGSQSGGEFRGTPNAVYPGGGFHAGFVNGSTSIVHSGPLKSTVVSTLSVDKQDGQPPHTFVMRYEFYNDHVVATMVQAGSSYWFLYEGTPGGSVDANDTVGRSDGTVTDISTSWTDSNGLGDSNGEEWVYFRDSAVGKYMYFVHDTPDNLKDSYYRMDVNGSMTVFGFGRNNDGGQPLLMTAQNNRFTFGIADGGSNFSATAQAINGEYRPVSATVGVGQKL